MARISTDDALIIYREEILGIPATLNYKEAKEFRKIVAEEVRVAAEKGRILDIPYELGDYMNYSS